MVPMDNIKVMLMIMVTFMVLRGSYKGEVDEQ
jgi:hypothetical protein